FFSSRRRHTRFSRDWSSDVCSSDLSQGLSSDAFTFRLQIQGPDADANPGSRWCAEILTTNGKGFIPYSDFMTQCWDPEGMYEDSPGPGVPYAGEPISVVVFLVPGAEMSTDYDRSEE